MNLQDPFFRYIVIGLCVCFLNAGCTEPASSRSEFVLGTLCVVNLYNRGESGIYREIFTRLREIESRMSAVLGESEIQAINSAAGIKPVKVTNDTFEVIESALHYAELSDGAFDPTIGPLVNLWGIGGDNVRLPDPEAVQAALSRVGWRDVELNREEGTVFLGREGMGLDLGGIAKGYAADEAVRIVKRHNLKRAIIDLGGNIYAYGEKAGKWPGKGLPWRIGIQDPLEERGQYFALLELRNKTVVTSGVYERFLEVDGKKYHHILSTTDGYPVDSGLLSVTIIADKSIDADALSTAVFALGWERGSALLNQIANAGGIFVFTDKTVRCTPGMEEFFTLINGSYHLAR